MVNRLIEFRSWYDSDVTCWRVVRPPPYDPLATEVFQIADVTKNVATGFWLSGQASSAMLLPARLSLSERAGKVIPARSADKLSALLRQMRLRHDGEG